MKKAMLTLLAALAATQFGGLDCTQSASKSDQLINAVEHGNIEDVTRLLGEGVSANIQEPVGGHTLLQMAVTQREMPALVKPVEIVKALLKAGANPNIQSNAGNTPLIYAVKYARRLGKDNTFEVIHLLIRAKADATIRNNKGKAAASYFDNLLEIC